MAPDVSQEGFQLSEKEVKECDRHNFRSVSRKKQEKLPPIQPGRFLEICPQVRLKRRWEKFWKKLHKYEWEQHKDLTALHHFSFGSHVPIHDTKTAITGFQCHLCLERVNSTCILKHLYSDCSCTKSWWDQLGMTLPMKLNSMLAPLNHEYVNMRNLNWYVDTVRRVYCSRRKDAESGIVLQPLSRRKLKKYFEHTGVRSQ